MSAMKTAMIGALGVAVGAGMMLMPGNQKIKRQAQKQMDKVMKLVKTW